MADTGTETRDRIRLLLVDDEEGYVNILSKRLSKRDRSFVSAQPNESCMFFLIISSSLIESWAQFRKMKRAIRTIESVRATDVVDSDFMNTSVLVYPVILEEEKKMLMIAHTVKNITLQAFSLIPRTRTIITIPDVSRI